MSEPASSRSGPAARSRSARRGTAAGTNFSLFSENAERVELCLFDDDDNEERIEVVERTALQLALLPARRRARPALRLPRLRPLRPRVRATASTPQAAHRPLRQGDRGRGALGARRARCPTSPTTPRPPTSSPTTRTTPRRCPKGLVVDPGFDWEGDRLLGTPWNETVIYETHVKGFTMLHPDVREDLRGTYGGLASEPAIKYLKELGVTAVELLPVHHNADEHFLIDKGLSNYWGYSSIGFLAPHADYAATGSTGEQVREFKGMVKALHKAGIEVILDVVYNHTAEGNHLGPMLSFKGIDNESYYRLMPDDPRFYMDFTGTGNSLNPVHPSVLRLIMDSLRYWVIECHVDGFRFDLASALARELYDVDRLSAFFDTIHQDPVLSQVKLIAEPWDVGPGGYQVGNFPVLWTEWNGIYRDTMRDFWRGQASVGDFASRLTGSSDLYARRRPPAVRVDQLRHRARRLHARRPRLLQREAQRGQPRGQPGRHRRQPLVELRRRGPDRRPRDHRAARAPAAQLPHDAAAVPGRADAARRRRVLAHAGRQQQRLVPGQRDLVVRLGHRRARQRAMLDVHEARSSRCARTHPVFRRRHFLQRRGDRGTGRCPTRGGFGPTGGDDPARLAAPNGHVVGLFLNGQEFPYRGRRGEQIIDDSFLLLINAHHEDVTFTLPARRCGPAVGARAQHRRPDAPSRARSRRRARARSRSTARSVTVLKRIDPADVVAELRATYRLQLGPGMRFDDVRALVPVPARPRHQPPVPVAVADGAVGLDARLRRRRPDAGVGVARRRGGAARARRRGPRDHPRHRPQPHGHRRREPLVGRSRRARARLRRRSRDRPLPALLRHRRPRGRARRGPRGLRADARARCSSLLADGVLDGLRIDHPDGLADPAGYLERLRGAGAARVWVEKILHPGEAAARLAGRGDRRLRVPQRRAGAVHRSGRRGAADGARTSSSTGDARSFDEVALEAQLEQARGDVRARGAAAARASTTRASSRRRSRGCRSTARTCATASFDRRRPRGAGGRRPARTSSTARPRSSSRAFSRPRRR